MELVRGIDESKAKRAIVKGIAAICGELNIKVLAEGIETIAERDCLRDLGIDLMQGYGAAGQARSTVTRNDGSRAGDASDSAYSVGTYATAVADSGAWLDLVVQGTRHGLSTNSVNSRQLNTAGLGWQASLQAGLPGELSDTLILEPQLQYSYQMQAMQTANDGAARVDFGQGSRQQVSLGLYFGNRIAGQNKGADVADAEANKPLSWWIKPVMTQTFGTRAEMKVDVPGVQGSAVGFKPNQNGTALALHVGVSGAVSNALVVGAQAGYSAVMGGAAPGGYQAQLMMKTKW